MEFWGHSVRGGSSIKRSQIGSTAKHSWIVTDINHPSRFEQTHSSGNPVIQTHCYNQADEFSEPKIRLPPKTHSSESTIPCSASSSHPIAPRVRVSGSSHRIHSCTLHEAGSLYWRSYDSILLWGDSKQPCPVFKMTSNSCLLSFLLFNLLAYFLKGPWTDQKALRCIHFLCSEFFYIHVFACRSVFIWVPLWRVYT